MLPWLKRITAGLVLLALAATASLYGLLSLSLPALDGTGTSSAVIAPVQIERDSLGQVVITANSRDDAAYGLGFAHGQDRFFQMDLLRRNAAGELSELFGKAAINLDEKMRFHQLRKRSEKIVTQLPPGQRSILRAYAQGVNEGKAQVGFDSFEYLLTGASARPWKSEDSILAIFSMYLDLQSANFERDKALLYVDHIFGEEMRTFILQPSHYQAALDGSMIAKVEKPIPTLERTGIQALIGEIGTTDLYGSNNWAVTGTLTGTGKAMLSDDMHLGLAVPSIWYRSQLNYMMQGKTVQVTGVSLPGAPAIVVGTNDNIAWGFTNGYLDTADWIALSEQDKTWQEEEHIQLPNQQSRRYSLLMSEYGPVKTFNGKKYALSWVAHQPYAVNLKLLEMESLETVQAALALAPEVGIPVQNMLVVDSLGNAGWRPAGAIPARTNPVDTAEEAQNYSSQWQYNEETRPALFNPEDGKLWTANSRVVSVQQHKRYGDGGYALGARAVQIRDRLLAQSQFNETDFNQLQQDNKALFLTRWHQHLVDLLSENETMKTRYARDLQHLAQWQACACETSVGYTLVKRFRESVIDSAFAPVEAKMKMSGASLRYIKRYLEPAIWQLIEKKPDSWLNHHDNWSVLQRQAYENAKQKLSDEFGPDLENWQWGTVNALQIKHPFSKQLPILSRFLDMPIQPAFGDTFMPAVQGPSFGASQRFIAQPGMLGNAIMTMAGGQSGHPLSPFYRAGFDDYAQGKATALLPGMLTHSLTIKPMN
ncbi:penicillin acylase family protein [Pseudoalteromonas sp. MMG013]|uniref:penicillin acylase family protein n=1 Tax=Pseudoalteromonas sp. MMG013 TaxID=2822687 RepID=UPI001B37831A|nr:penicillin acylase family protein [Pseudoalteromonas sp. MMG013]MBQ4863354.1 penicillin acylase family protein [Pseudoalteromonas sp. MMG013]